jgi:hypothetical protein
MLKIRFDAVLLIIMRFLSRLMKKNTITINRKRKFLFIISLRYSVELSNQINPVKHPFYFLHPFISDSLLRRIIQQGFSKSEALIHVVSQL